jgi:hypothetical protein
MRVANALFFAPLFLLPFEMSYAQAPGQAGEIFVCPPRVTASMVQASVPAGWAVGSVKSVDLTYQKASVGVVQMGLPVPGQPPPPSTGAARNIILCAYGLPEVDRTIATLERPASVVLGRKSVS